MIEDEDSSLELLVSENLLDNLQGYLLQEGIGPLTLQVVTFSRVVR